MTKQLIDQLRKTHSATVDELIPTLLRLSEVQQVLKNLLQEGVPIRPLHLVLETIGDHATQDKDLDELTEKVRQRLARTLCQRLCDSQGRIRAITLDPWIEDALASAEASGRKVQASLPPSMFRSLIEQLKHFANTLEDQARPAVLLVNPQIRPLVRQTLGELLPRLHILSTSEISSGVQVESIGLVEMPESVPT
jgi:flagellar biosynthesis protein FlhA